MYFSDTNSPMFYTSLDSFLGVQLTSLVNSVAEQCSKHAAASADSYPKYLYFNKLNLAYKSTIHCDNRRLSNNSTTPEVLRIITDMNSDTRRYVEIFKFMMFLFERIMKYFYFQTEGSWRDSYKDYERLLDCRKVIQFKRIFRCYTAKACQYN